MMRLRHTFVGIAAVGGIAAVIASACSGGCPEGQHELDGECYIVCPRSDRQLCDPDTGKPVRFGDAGDGVGGAGTGVGAGAGGGVPTLCTKNCSLEATKVVAGSNHSCALMKDGTVRCWGDNAFGQTAGSSPSQPVAGLPGIVKDLVAAANGTCARLLDQTVWCWGDNALGALPVTAKGALMMPTVADALPPTAEVSLSCNGGCALVSDQGGEALRCWADPSYDSSLDKSRSGMNLTHSMPGFTGLTAVTAGLISVCVLTSGRKPRCWYNESQGMFAGTTLECDSTDPAAAACPPANASANAHELFSKNVVQIATHGIDTFAVTDDHVLWVDGGGWWGLGIGPIPPPDPNAPIPCSTERQDFCGSGGVQKVKLTNVARVVVGHGGCGVDATHIAAFSTCAVTTDNALYCWGFNDSGQLGFETAKDMDDKLSPTGDPIKVPLPAPVSDAALGDAHACAVTTAGEVYCWGYDAKGQLGDGGGIGGTGLKKVGFQNP